MWSSGVSPTRCGGRGAVSDARVCVENNLQMNLIVGSFFFVQLRFVVVKVPMSRKIQSQLFVTVTTYSYLDVPTLLFLVKVCGNSYHIYEKSSVFCLYKRSKLIRGSRYV